MTKTTAAMALRKMTGRGSFIEQSAALEDFSRQNSEKPAKAFYNDHIPGRARANLLGQSTLRAFFRAKTGYFSAIIAPLYRCATDGRSNLLVIIIDKLLPVHTI